MNKKDVESSFGLLSVATIREKLKDRDFIVLAKRTGINYATLLKIADENYKGSHNLKTIFVLTNYLRSN